MGEQCSSKSTSSIPLLNEDKLTSPSFSVPKSTLSDVSSQSISRKWMDPIPSEPGMRLDECMNFIATVSGIQNPTLVCMGRTFRRISAINMSNELLKDMLDDYADLFKINFTIIPFDNNMFIDFQRSSLFIGTPLANGQSKYQHGVFILYDHKRQVFKPFYVGHHTNNSQKVRFDENDDKDIYEEICDFIDKWNRGRRQCSTSEMNNIIGNNVDIIKSANSSETDNNVAQFPSASNNFTPASEVIKSSVQLVLQMVTSMACQLDHIQLKQKSTQALLHDFNHLSDKDKVDMLCHEMISVTEIIRMTAIPDHEEEVEEISSMETEDGRYVEAPGETNKNLNAHIIHVQQNISCSSKSSTTLKRLTTTADVREPNMTSAQYGAPKTTREPTGYQHIRMFSDLTSSNCSLMQGGAINGPQQTYVEIEVPNEDGTNLYVAVRAVTVKKNKHPFKSVVPQNPPIDTSTIDHGERSCLKCDKKDFDPDLEYTYLPISPKERTQGRKEILAHLINWSRKGAGHTERVIKENLNLCKLEFYLCIRGGHGNYQFVSPPSYSSIIEEGDGPVEITSNADDKKQLCQQGGQIIALSLTVKCLKRGLRVLCNGEELDDTKFKIDKKQLLIISPPKKPDSAKLYLTILRNEYNDEIGANTDRTLYEDEFEYISHDNPPTHVS